jgi:hypothetical protein
MKIKEKCMLYETRDYMTAEYIDPIQINERGACKRNKKLKIHYLSNAAMDANS